jgi:aspartate kinase
MADPGKIEAAAGKVAAEAARGHRVAVTVSAMAGVTNRLVGYCEAIAPVHDSREYDVVVASGEQITAGLMAMALQKQGLSARSWLGWQVPITCEGMHAKARVRDIATDNLHAALDKGEVAVVPGFQGITRDGRVATLGRGGSDTSAVALAAALGAERCDIYTDVDGVYTADPRIVPGARKISHIAYEPMLELASLGSKVLQTRSVEIAMKHGVALQVLSSFGGAVGSDMPGTLVTKETPNMEQEVVSGVAHSQDEAKITLLSLPDTPGVAAGLFGPLAAAGVNVDMIVQNVAADGKRTDMTFTVARADLPRALQVVSETPALSGVEVRTADNVAKVSIVGVGMRSHAGVASKMFAVLAEKGVNIQVISTSEIKISVLIDEAYMELTIRALHTAFGLGG